MGEIRDFSLGNYANQGDVDIQTVRQQYALSKGKSPEEAQALAQSSGKDKEVMIWMRQTIARDDNFSPSISEQGLERLKSAAHQLGLNAQINETQKSFFKKVTQLFTKETAVEARHGLIQQLNSAQIQKLLLLSRELTDDKGKMNARQEMAFMALLGSTLPKLSKLERREVLQAVIKSDVSKELAKTLDDPVSKRAFQKLCREAYATGQLHTLIAAMDLPMEKKNEAFAIAKATVHEEMKHSISHKFSLKAAILGSPETRLQSIKIPSEQGKTDPSESLKFSREIIAEAAVDLIQEKLEHSKLVSPDSSFTSLVKVAREITKISITSQLSLSTQEKIKIPIPQSCAQNGVAMQKAHDKIRNSGMQQAVVKRLVSHYVEGALPGAQTHALAGVHVLLKILQLPPEKISTEQKTVLYDLLSLWGSDPKSYERTLLPIAYDRLRQAYEEHSANFPPFPLLNTMDMPSPESFKHLQLHQLLFDEKPSLENFARLALLFQQFGVSVIDPVSSEPLSREAQIQTLSKRPNSEILQDLLYGQLHGTEGMEITLEAIKRKLPTKVAPLQEPEPPPRKTLPVIEEGTIPKDAESNKQKARVELTGTTLYATPPVPQEEAHVIPAVDDTIPPVVAKEEAPRDDQRGTTVYATPPQATGTNLTELVQQLLGPEPPQESTQAAPQLGSISFPKGTDIYGANSGKMTPPVKEGRVQRQYFAKKEKLTEEELIRKEMRIAIHKNAYKIWDLTVPGQEATLRALLKEGFESNRLVVAGLELAKECYNVDDDEFKLRMATLLQIEEEVKKEIQ